MEKKNKWAFSIALAALSYFRMVLVVCSIVAWTEREWIGLGLSALFFGITTHLLNKVLDYPSNETIKELTIAVNMIEPESKY